MGNFIDHMDERRNGSYGQDGVIRVFRAWADDSDVYQIDRWAMGNFDDRCQR